MTEYEPEKFTPRPRCLICKQWQDEFASRNNLNEMFRIRKGSKMEKWIEKHSYRRINEPLDDRFICEVHFNRLDILRIAPWNQKPLKTALLTDRNVMPIYFNQISVRKYNTIEEFKDIRAHYKRCLDTRHWTFESFFPKLVMRCTKNANSLVIQPSLYVHYYNDGAQMMNKKLDKNFTTKGKVKSWSRLRGLMRYLEMKGLQTTDEK